MHLKIIQEKENPLFKRKEIIAEIMAVVTPSVKEVEDLLSEKFSKPSKNIKIKNIKGKFGAQVFKVEANIYDSEEAKEQIEIKTQKEKGAEKKSAQENAQK